MTAEKPPRFQFPFSLEGRHLPNGIALSELRECVSEQMLQIRQDNAVARSGIPLRHQRNVPRTRGHPATEKWVKALREVAARLLKGGTLCVVCGAAGSGKTQLGVEAVRLVCQVPVMALYRTTGEISAGRKPSGFSGGEWELMRHLKSADLLVIDEMDKVWELEHEAKFLFELLDSRYREMSDTIIVCNGDRQHVENMLGPSVSRRAAETGGIILLDDQLPYGPLQ